MKVPAGSIYDRWKYVEVARYVPNLGRVIRETRKIDKNTREPIIFDWADIESWRERRDNFGLYTSVWRYDLPNVEQGTRLGSLYFDFDDKENPEAALRDARLVVEHLVAIVRPADIRIYFTGEKGYHVEVEAIALGISPSNELPRVFRYIGEHLRNHLGLNTLDFAVYDVRRMWRLPGSRHQTTGLYKTELTPAELLFELTFDGIRELASEARTLAVPDPVFDARANEWYRSLEEEEESRRRKEYEDRIARFNEAGTGVSKHTKAYIQAAVNGVIEELKATGSGSRNHTLNRCAFRLYTFAVKGEVEEEWVTDTLKEIALGIGLAERETEATLRSALRAAKQKKM